MPKLTRQQVLDSIVAKSDQLNAADITGGPITVTITGAEYGDIKQPWILPITGGHQPWRPCKGMRRIMVAEWGDDPNDYSGKRVTLHRVEDVLYSGQEVGGVEILAMSGLKAPKKFSVRVNRGKTKTVEVQPLTPSTPDTPSEIVDVPAEPTAEDKADIATMTAEIVAAQSLEVMKAIKFAVEKKSQAVRDALRGPFMQRQAELKAPENMDSEPE